jgi:HAE1 family hydrophobic/amphiphilic exporter-1
MSVTITIVTSVFAAITLTPTLSSLMLKWYPIKTEAPWYTYDGSIRKGLNWLDRFYEKTLRWALHHKTVVSFIAVVVFALSMSLFLVIGTEFFPQTDESRLSATIQLQTGTRVEETTRISDKLNDLIRTKYPEVTIMSTSSGYDDQGGFASIFSSQGTHTITYSLHLVPIEQRKKSSFELAEDLRKDFASVPEIIDYKVTTSSNMGGSFGGSTVDVEIYGYDIAQTNIVAEALASKIKNIKGAKDVAISRDKSKPELQIIFDQNKMAANGLNTAMVSSAVKNRVDGLTATRLRQYGDEYDIVVRYKRSSTSTLTDVENIGITNPMGQIIRLGEIAQIKEYWAPPTIERKRKERIVTVSFTPYKESLTVLQTEVQKIIDSTELPAGVMVQLSGAIKDQADSFKDIAMLMLISLILVYLIMASQFESLKMPFIIMFSIPFAFSGVAIALFVTHTSLSVISAIGAVMLIGIVVKNAVVLVDFINLMRERGLELYDAIALSGRSRLRPVLMTSATTILGMLPLAMSAGSGSELWSPMGVAVIGGLVFSTVVTLVLVPVVYAIFSKHGERNKNLASYSEMDFMNGNNKEVK